VDSNSFTTYCKCSPFYKGDNCQLKCPVDDVDDICSNRGSCIEDPFSSSAICICLPGFIGSHCQFSCDENSTCSSHGTCNFTNINGTELVSCQCNDGFFGSACQISCSPEMNCSSHGTCKYTRGPSEVVQCLCDPGRTGKDCTMITWMDTTEWIYSINSILAIGGLFVLVVILVIALVVMIRKKEHQYDFLEK